MAISDDNNNGNDSDYDLFYQNHNCKKIHHGKESSKTKNSVWLPQSERHRHHHSKLKSKLKSMKIFFIF
jgi:hypothetical protein